MARDAHRSHSVGVSAGTAFLLIAVSLLISNAALSSPFATFADAYLDLSIASNRPTASSTLVCSPNTGTITAGTPIYCTLTIRRTASVIIAADNDPLTICQLRVRACPSVLTEPAKGKYSVSLNNGTWLSNGVFGYVLYPLLAGTYPLTAIASHPSAVVINGGTVKVVGSTVKDPVVSDTNCTIGGPPQRQRTCRFIDRDRFGNAIGTQTARTYLPAADGAQSGATCPYPTAP